MLKTGNPIPGPWNPSLVSRKKMKIAFCIISKSAKKTSPKLKLDFNFL